MQRRITIGLIWLLQWAVILVQSGKFSENAWAEGVRWLALGCLCVLIYPARGARLRGFSMADFFAGIFLLLALTSVWDTPYQQTGLLRAISAILLYVAVFWSLWHFADQAGEEIIVRSLGWCLGLCLLVGLLAGPTGLVSAWQADGRFRGLMSNPNSVGLLGAIALPGLLIQAIERRRWMDLIFVLSAAVSVLLSGSRTAALGSGFAVILILARAGMRRGLVALVAVGALVGGLLTFRPWEQSEGYSGTTLFDNPLSRLSFKDDTLMGGGRFEIWPMAIDAIKQSPLLGHGFGTEEFWLDEMGVTAEDFSIHQGKYMHNSYLGLTYQLGLVGTTVLFMPLFGLVLKATLRLLRQRLSLRQTGYLAMLIAGLIAAGAESWIYSVGNAFCFPFWTAIMLLIRSLATDPRRAGVALPSTPPAANLGTQ